MAEYKNEVLSLLSTSVIKKVLHSERIKISEVNKISTLLMKACIDFELSYTSGSNREAAAVEFSIYISPNTTLDFVIPF